MRNEAERFVAHWIAVHVSTASRLKPKPETVEYLTRKLEAGAWEFGLTRGRFLDAVDGDAYEYVLHEVEQASARPRALVKALGALTTPRPRPGLAPTP
jgi:hypothetical protein